MSNSESCPVCHNKHGGACSRQPTTGDRSRFKCSICGTYELSGSVYAGPLYPEDGTLTDLERLALSHNIRRQTDAKETIPIILSDWLDRFRKAASLPTPSAQAANAVRWIGDTVRHSLEPLKRLPEHFFASIGSPSPRQASQLVKQLQERGWVLATSQSVISSPAGMVFLMVDLTLAGWEQYEAELRGQVNGKYGFLALKFGDPVLDPFVDNVIKPRIKAKLNFDIFDMRDVAQAGIIDNIMRAQIRDAAFVLVDLTHDNQGAYWEAGYAEGLGKPVIYLCERSKFESAKTHFDTNHCTTIIWSADRPDDFEQQAVSTIRRSLNMFAEEVRR
ncbi:MAG: hypothetical protein ACRDBH_06250 [Bosea sp. (in: a-proteobacteria)]